MVQIPSDAKGVLFVVSTSHMDWHWHSTFEQYYVMGNYHDGHSSVRSILNGVSQLLPSLPLTETTGSHVSPYKYNLAETAWLKRYLLDYPGYEETLAGYKGYFSFIGGGITSPDSLNSAGEAFIRNYLEGRNYLKSKGLGGLITNNCWVPDDFGHDAQLPVVLQAMGFTGVSFARVSGGQPTTPYTANPADQNQSYQLAKNGVTFNWVGADGSTVLAYYMLFLQQNPAYGWPWQQDSASSYALNQFITQNVYPNLDGSGDFTVNQPGLIMMTPCGGDFSSPEQILPQAVDEYNQKYYSSTGKHYNNTGVYAVMASFDDFVQYVSARVNNKTLTINPLQATNDKPGTFDPTTYWTGHLGNYVQLKINQHRTANRLLSAETLSVLLRAYSYLSDYMLDGLDLMITNSWNDLLPSTHHDYVTGTSPTSIYYQEQLPLSEQALSGAEASLKQGMRLLASSVVAAPGANEVPYVVFNPAGTSRTLSTLVEIPASEVPAGTNSYYYYTDAALTKSSYFPFQKLANGNVLIQIAGLASMGYTVVYLSPVAPDEQLPVITQKTADSQSFYMSNGAVTLGIDRTPANGWAISLLQLPDGTQINSGLCNHIQPYSEGTYGNPYQFGNEINQENGFILDSSAAYQTLTGNVVESGPYRWRFEGTMSNTPSGATGESQIKIEYILHLNEQLVQMRVTGNAAAGAATSVVTSWNLNQVPSAPPAMSYGTANHWNGPYFTQYYSGPMFRGTHDYLTVANAADLTGNPVGAIYHEGMRAWAFNDGQLMGVLLRNTNNNGGRGASNIDTDVHTQNYAFRLPGVGNAASGQPIQESIQFQTPLAAAKINAIGATEVAMMPSFGNLASVSGSAVIRMARAQAGSGGAPLNTGPNCPAIPMPFSFVLRIYQPSNSSTGNWQLSVPFTAVKQGGNTPVASLVTAVEDEIAGAPAISLKGGLINFTSLQTLTTVRIQASGMKITPSNYTANECDPFPPNWNPFHIGEDVKNG